jgi:thioredoxin-like negative regulator of GroEL
VICKSIEGTVSALSQKYKGQVKFIRLNVDGTGTQGYLKTFNVRGTPTVVLIDRHGHTVANVPGWPGEQQVVQALDRLVAQP